MPRELSPLFLAHAAPDQFYAPDGSISGISGKGNMNGYWEHAAILDTDQEILSQNRTDWASPAGYAA
jgi:hypothetical protein